MFALSVGDSLEQLGCHDAVASCGRVVPVDVELARFTGLPAGEQQRVDLGERHSGILGNLLLAPSIRSSSSIWGALLLEPLVEFDPGRMLRRQPAWRPLPTGAARVEMRWLLRGRVVRQLGRYLDAGLDVAPADFGPDRGVELPVLFDIPVAYRVAESASLSAGLITWLLLDPTKAPTAVLSPAPRAPQSWSAICAGSLPLSAPPTLKESVGCD